MYTPWGQSQNSEKIARGIIFYSTASHGGIHLSPTMNSQVHEAWRSPDGWYEEDIAYHIVVLTFPDKFSEENVRIAHRSLMNWYPDQYEQARKIKVLPEDSSVLRERIFLTENKGRYIVQSAWGSWQSGVPQEYVGVFAKRSGIENDTGKYFLVLDEEYAQRTGFGFVIDENRHQEWTEHPGAKTKQVAIR
jgi:hypothetical protein